MLYARFELPEQEGDFLGLINLEGLDVKTIKLSDSGTIAQVLYEYLDESADRETEALTVLMDKALLVRADSEYYALKNSRQREIYLLVKYRIGRESAATVSELLKDELGGVLAGYAKARGVTA